LKFSKLYTPLLVLLSLAGLVFFLALFSSVRPESDDMVISLEERCTSFWWVLMYKYKFYSFRPVYTLFSFLTIGYSNDTSLYHNSVFVFYFLLMALLVFSMYKLLKELFSVDTSRFKHKLLLACFSLNGVSCLYFFTTERIEIFGWISDSIIHLAPVVFIFFATWVLIKKQRRWFDYPLLFLAAPFISGGAQHIPLVVLLIMFCIAAVFFIEKKWKFSFVKNGPQFMRVVFFGVVLALFFLLFNTNPGMRLHERTAQNYLSAHPQSGYGTMQAIKMFFQSYKIIGVLLLCVNILLFPKILPVQMPQHIGRGYFLLALFCAGIVCAWASVRAYHTLTEAKIWFPFDVTVFLFVVSYLLRTAFLPTVKNWMVAIGGTLALAAILWHDIRHIPALRSFAREHDRIVSDLQKKPAGDLVVIENFPPPDLTSQVVLREDPNNPENRLFCRFYLIKAKVSVKNSH
jgi:hypothetical protein